MLEVLRFLGLDVRKEKRAWALSYNFRTQVSLPHFKCLEVVGPFAHRRTACPVLAVDGAANLLEDYDILLSDLDGASEEEVIKASRERILLLVIHGDNVDKALRLPLGDKVVPVVQSPKAHGLCVPAFSDGDKAVMIALSIADEVVVSGFGEGEQPRESKRSLVTPLKERKLATSRAYLEALVGGYWGRTLDEGVGRSV